MAGEIPDTAGEPPEQTEKRVKALSLHSFWWRIINKAFKSAKEPFENVGLACAIFAGLVALGFIFHFITQELGDYMIYWSIAFPVIVLLVWFVWNLIKAPHQIHQEDVAAAISGAASAVPVPKTRLQKLIPFFFVAAIVASFGGMLLIKNRQIAKLQKQLSPPKQEITAKRLPDKVIPDPNNAVRAPAIVAAPAAGTNIPMQKSFETNNPNADDSSDLIGNILAAHEAAERQKEENAQRNAQAEWSDNLDDRNYSLQSLYDTLCDEAKKSKDGVVMTEGYFQCIPKTVNVKDAEKIIAEIGFQIETNVHFAISTIDGSPNSKALKISSSCGEMLFCAGWDHTNQPAMMLQIQKLNYADNENFQNGMPHEFIKKQMRLFVAAQIKYSNPTNQ